MIPPGADPSTHAGLLCFCVSETSSLGSFSSRRWRFFALSAMGIGRARASDRRAPRDAVFIGRAEQTEAGVSREDSHRVRWLQVSSTVGGRGCFCFRHTTRCNSKRKIEERRNCSCQARCGFRSCEMLLTWWPDPISLASSILMRRGLV